MPYTHPFNPKEYLLLFFKVKFVIKKIKAKKTWYLEYSFANPLCFLLIRVLSEIPLNVEQNNLSVY